MSRVPISEEQAQRMMAQEQQRKDREAQVDEQKESMLRAFVSSEGRERLKRIEQVKKERAHQVEMHIIQAVRAGKLQPPVSDDTVREILTQVSSQEAESGASKITFARKKMDDDW